MVLPAQTKGHAQDVMLLAKYDNAEGLLNDQPFTRGINDPARAASLHHAPE